jgi:hypothetical protein
MVLQTGVRQSFAQLAPRLITHLLAVDISYRAVPTVDLGLDRFEILTNAFRPPLITVANAAAALHKPVAPGPPHSVESGKDGFEMLAGKHPPVCQ